MTRTGRRPTTATWAKAKIRRLQSGESSRSAPERRESVSNPFVERANRRRRNRIWEYAQRYPLLSGRERQAALELIEQDLRWLDELRQAISRR